MQIKLPKKKIALLTTRNYLCRIEMNMQKRRVLLESAPFELTLERLCRQLIEEYDDFSNTCLVGIQTGGVYLAQRLRQRLLTLLGADLHLPLGKLDITFYRDDFRTRDKPLIANEMKMDFLIEDKKVILLDDVLYSGRSVHAALTALNHYGRPRSVELLVLVDRRFNRKLPIYADYTGIVVDTLDDAYVVVEWAEIEGADRVSLYPEKT